MDNVDRMYRHLARTIRSRFPQYLTQPFDVAALHQTILPYRLHRRELGLETNEDYEITLMQLLAGPRDYLIVDDRVREALRTELAAVNPDPSAFKQFAATNVALSPAALRSLDAGPDDPTTPLKVAAVPSIESLRPEASAQGDAPTPMRTAPSAPPVAAPSTTTPQPESVPPAPALRATPTTVPSGARALTPHGGERC